VIGIALNLGFVAIEGTYGFLSNSLALLSDAGHNLSDVLGLSLAWFATWLAKRRPSPQFTYGLRSSSILAAVVNAVILLVAVSGIIWEAIVRLGSPSPINSTTVMAVAGAGIVVNGVTAALFASGRKSDLNIRGAFLHMVADTLISAGVVVAGFVMLKTGLTWIDPVVSIVIGLIIIWGTWGLLKDSIFMALAGVPGGIHTASVESFLLEQVEVSRVHDLHIWALSTSQTALTAHLVCANEKTPSDRFIFDLSRKLNDIFKIGHVTIQIERGDEVDCPQSGDDCL
jgi:cobalt-zinc-cadmium efflux system protein